MSVRNAQKLQVGKKKYNFYDLMFEITVSCSKLERTTERGAEAL